MFNVNAVRLEPFRYANERLTIFRSTFGHLSYNFLDRETSDFDDDCCCVFQNRVLSKLFNNDLDLYIYGDKSMKISRSCVHYYCSNTARIETDFVETKYLCCYNDV